MGIVIEVPPIDVDILGTIVNFQGDPVPSPEWDALMEVKVFYVGPKSYESQKQMTEGLAALAHTTEDAELFVKMELGVKTLKQVVDGYASAVTGFPTQPPSRSTTRSKKTGGT